MRTLKNQKGFVEWIPLILLIGFVLYVVGALAWSKVETWARHRELIAEHRAAQEAKIEEKRIALHGDQLKAVMAQNARLIDENAKTADRIADAHEKAAGEIARTNENAVNMLLTWAKEGPQATDKAMVYLLAAVALCAVLGLVAAVFLLVRGRRYPDGPVIIAMEGGHQVNGRIASGADVYRLIEHRKESIS